MTRMARRCRLRAVNAPTYYLVALVLTSPALHDPALRVAPTHARANRERTRSQQLPAGLPPHRALSPLAASRHVLTPRQPVARPTRRGSMGTAAPGAQDPPTRSVRRA